MSEVMGRRERERAQRRIDILDAAEHCFAEKGFHGTTVDDVAQRAEFAVGTLYKFFAGKDELYEALIRERMVYLIDAALSALEGVTDIREFVRVYLETKIRLCCAKPDFVRMYTRERMSDRFAKTALWTEVLLPNWERLMLRMVEAFEIGMKSGELRDDVDSYDMVIACDNLTDGFLFDALDEDNVDKFATKIDVMMKLIFDGVSRK